MLEYPFKNVENIFQIIHKYSFSWKTHSCNISFPEVCLLLTYPDTKTLISFGFWLSAYTSHCCMTLATSCLNIHKNKTSYKRLWAFTSLSIWTKLTGRYIVSVHTRTLMFSPIHNKSIWECYSIKSVVFHACCLSVGLFQLECGEPVCLCLTPLFPLVTMEMGSTCKYLSTHTKAVWS